MSIEYLPGLGPQIRSGEINEIVSASVEYGFQHIEREALGHFDGNAGRDRKHGPAHHRVDEHRPVMGERVGDTFVDICRVLEPYPAHAAGLGHGGKVWILELGAEVKKTG